MARRTARRSLPTERRLTIEQLLKYAPALVLIVGLSYWVTLPARTLSVGRACEPDNLADQIAAALHPSAFWRGQLDALREERQIQERLQAKSGFGAEPNANKIVTAIERKMDRLSDRAAAEETQTQQKARLDRIEWLTACEARVGARISQ